MTWELPSAARAPWNHLQELQERTSLASRTQAAIEIIDRAKAEQQTTSDYSGRYPIELVQNAHDAAGQSGATGRAWLHLTESALIVANDGRPFDDRRVTALMRYGDSPKDADKSGTADIGYKGIGFSSVFEVSDNPQIVSSGLGFQLHRERARAAVEDLLGVPVERVPGRGYPLALEPEDLGDDLDTVARLFEEGAVTVVRLPLRAGIGAASVHQDCLGVLNRRTLLFLPNLGRLELRGLLGPASWRRTKTRTTRLGQVMNLADGGERESWLVRRSTLPIEEGETARLPNDVWADVRTLNLAVAVPWDGSKPAEASEPQRLHVYFPTEVELGRGLIVQGDFFVDSSRKHLLTDAVCGPLNDRLAIEAGRLAATLVEDLIVESGSRGLGVLRSIGTPSEIAARIWATTVAELRGRPVVPTRLGVSVLPTASHFLDPDSEVPKLVREAVTVLAGRVTEDFETHRPAKAVLHELGSNSLAALAVAQSLDPSATNPDYGRWLRELSEWLDCLSATAHHQMLPFLRDRPIVQRDRDGGWVPPTSVVVRAPGIPKLPAYAHRDEVREHPAARAVLDRLKVPMLDLGAAVDLVLDGIDPGGSSDEERYASALAFIRAAWTADRQALQSATTRLGEVCVPVRTALAAGTGPEPQDWIPANGTYFDTDWQTGSPAAAIYGPLEVAEFLADPPPASPSGLTRLRSFYRALGVLDVPHVIAEGEAATATTLQAWKRSPGWVAAQCPEGHHGHLKIVSGPMSIERLDRVLTGTSAEGRAALRRFLLRRDQPLGPRVTIRCTHGWHGRHPSKQAESLDQWLLRTSAWLPVVGSDELVSPEACWTTVVGSARDLAIRICALPEREARALGVPSFTDPRPDALERELIRLASPDSGMDPDLAWTTGVAVVRRLAAVRTGARPKPSPPLPVTVGGQRSWSAEAVVGDLPGAERIDGLAVLTAPGARQLATRYGLALASDVVDVEVSVDGVMRGERMLTPKLRVSLVAALHADGADLKNIARWMGRLEEVRAKTVSVTLSYPGVVVERQEPMHLEPIVTREGRTTVKRGVLRWSSWDESLATDLLVDYLEEGGRRALVALVLHSPDAALRLTRVGAEDLEDARVALDQFTPAGQDELELSDDDRIDGHERGGHQDGGGDGDGGADGTGASNGATRGGSAGSEDDGSGSSGSGGGSSAGGGGAGAGRRQGDGNGAGGGTAGRPGGTPGGSGGSVAGGSNGSPGRSTSRPSRRPPRRDRVRRRLNSYVAGPGDGEGSDHNDGDETRSQRIGDRGELATMEYEETAGRKPERQRRNNPGFDIISRGGARDRYIEVKAIDGPWTSMGVGLTRREYETALEKGGDYYLYVVEFALSDHPLVSEIRNPARRVDRYFFDDGWRAVAEVPESVGPPPIYAWMAVGAAVARPVPIWDPGPIGQGELLGILPYDDDDWEPGWFGVVVQDRSLGPHFHGGVGVYLAADGELDDGELVLVETIGGPDAPMLTHRRVEYQFDDEGAHGRPVLIADNAFSDPAPWEIGDARVIGTLQRRLLPDEVRELLGGSGAG